MNLAIDVQYDGGSATVAGILFEDWSSSAVLKTVITKVNGLEPYESGTFYKRELPSTLELLKKIENLDVIASFVKLGVNRRRHGLIELGCI